MRTDIKTSSTKTTDSNGNTYKKVTTTKTLKVTVGDIIGTAESAGKAIQVLKKKAADPTIAKTAIAGLITPFLAFATTVDAIKKVIAISAVVTPIATLLARGSGIWSAPGNVAEIIKLGINTITKVLIAIALNALVLLKDIIWNYEIDLGTIKSETLTLLSTKVTKNGNVIKNKISSVLSDLPSIASSNDSTTMSSYSKTSSYDSTTSEVPTNISAQVSSTITNDSSTIVPNAIKPSVFLNSTSSFSTTNVGINAILNPAIKEYIIAIINDTTLYTKETNILTQQIYNEVEPLINQYIFEASAPNEDFGTPALSIETSPLKTVVSSDSIYYIQKMDSVIDWENDVGCQPIYPVTVNDLINYSKDTPTPLYNYNDIENTENYFELVKETKEYLDKKLSDMKSNLGIIIDDTSIDVTDLVADADLNDKRKIIELANSFDESQKIVSKELANEYLEAILNLPEYKIKELVAMGLYETEFSYRSYIKSLIVSIKQMSPTNALNLINDYNITFDFSYGLSIAFYNYLKAVSTNTIILNEQNDKNIIKLAADFYKQEERSNLITDIKNKVISINPIENNNIDQYYSINYTKLTTDLKTYLNTQSWADKAALKLIIKDYMEQYSLIIVETEDETDRINNIILTTKNNMFKNVESIKSNISFSTFASITDSFPSSMSIDEKIKGYKYLTEIHNKLLTRVTELLNLSYDSIPDYTKDNLGIDIRNKILSSHNSIKKEIEFQLNLVIDNFTDETLEEERLLLDNRMNNMNIKVSADNILEEELYYYINCMKNYFYTKSGLL